MQQAIHSSHQEPIARDAMTAEVLAVESHWTVNQLVKFFRERNLSEAPVVESNGDLVGTVSLGELAKFLAKEVLENKGDSGYSDLVGYFAEQLLSQATKIAGSEKTIGEIMKPVVIEASVHTPLHEIVDQMVIKSQDKVWVKKDSQVVGVITVFDLLKLNREIQ